MLSLSKVFFEKVFSYWILLRCVVPGLYEKKKGFHKSGPIYIVGNGSAYLTDNNFLIAVPKSTSPRATWRKEAIQMSALHNGVSNTHLAYGVKVLTTAR